jgi:vacuolar protein sorting-associated protein 26
LAAHYHIGVPTILFLSCHQVEFIGSIELVYGSEHEFVSLERELQPPGALTQSLTTFPFDFSAVEKAHESYNGMNVTLRYFLRVTISRSLAPNITQEMNIWVQSPAVPASTVTDFNPIKMEVCLRACLIILRSPNFYSGWYRGLLAYRI